MKALIDGDILRYEIGFGAETGWRAIQENIALLEWRSPIPPFDYVASLLEQRLEWIMTQTQATSYKIFITEGRTFRFDIATTRPYKGSRIEKKPWHFKNLTGYLEGVLDAEVVTGIEADDAITLEHLASNGSTIICSRDKDLRQVSGRFYSWELGNQPSFGPTDISDPGTLSLSEDRKKIRGTGFASFCAQVLMGDATDNIPGLGGCGPVATYNYLRDCHTELDYLVAVTEAYYLSGMDDEYLLEQGRLCWMTRRLNSDGSPELWQIGMTE